MRDDSPLAQTLESGLASIMLSPTDRLRTSETLGKVRKPILARFLDVRAFTRRLAEPLTPEDQVVQSMADVSPTKWHLAHTSWFFENFILRAYQRGFRPFHPKFGFLFNSYYETVGPQHSRPQRGLLSRPTVEEVHAYRSHVEKSVSDLLAELPDGQLEDVERLIELGLQHEQQHQELLLMDIKHVFSCNPLMPAYLTGEVASGKATGSSWIERTGGVCEIGIDPESGRFHFDNEAPRHRVMLRDHALASRTVTCGEYLEFIEDGGYERSDLWLADGWDKVQRRGWRAPDYWFEYDGGWQQFTLAGPEPVREDAPVVHVSYFEADAYARWRDARLPTEAEWETAAEDLPVSGQFVEESLDEGRLHPRSSTGDAQLADMYGSVWEWTRTPYGPYPGFRPWSGSIGEYNGKFMCNQFVLRGGACVTSRNHLRSSYRNFFYPHQRWQFAGIRLAKDV